MARMTDLVDEGTLKVMREVNDDSGIYHAKLWTVHGAFSYEYEMENDLSNWSLEVQLPN